MENISRRSFGLKEIVLGAALVVGTVSLALGVQGCTNYQGQLKQIRNKINSSQISEGDKNEYKLVLDSIDLKDLSEEEKAFMKLSLKQKRKKIYNQYSKEELNYLHGSGLIDKTNLSHGDCLYLEKIDIAKGLGGILSQ